MARFLPFVGFVLLALCFVSSVSASLNGLYYHRIYGKGTWYQQANVWQGNCQIADNMGLRTIAVADNLWMNSLPCGMCLQINGTGSGSGDNPITGYFAVLVTDRCPTCGANGLDFADTTQLDGLWDINYKAVPCPVGSHKFRYQFQGSNSHYLKFVVMNTLVPIAGISANQSGTLVPFTHTNDGWWQASATWQFSPLELVITSINGEVVVDRLNIASAPQNGPGPNGFSQLIDGSGQQFTDSSIPPPGSGSAALRSWLSALYLAL